MPVSYNGSAIFHEQCQPHPSKNEFGIDTLSRKFRGPATKLSAFLSGLAQGQVYNSFYLQTWAADEDPVFPTVTLSYKGLLRRIPDPISTDDTAMQSVSLSTSRDDPEGSGKVINWVRDIQFWASTTTWKYISNSRPTAPRYTAINGNRNPVIFRSSITGSNGKVYAGANAPADLITSLTPAATSIVQSSSAEQVYGTPWFECQDTVIRTFTGS